jgi:hypothetical protein
MKSPAEFTIGTVVACGGSVGVVMGTSIDADAGIVITCLFDGSEIVSEPLDDHSLEIVGRLQGVELACFIDQAGYVQEGQS